jgi:uncharacterized protein (TIGR03546 family)
MFSFIRKFGKVFRGGVHPLEVGISVAMGVMAGVVLGQNGLVVVLLFLILVLNTNKTAMALAGVPFGAMGITLTEYKFLVGRWALSQEPLARFFELLANAPVGALLGFNRYTVVGGFIAGIPLAILSGLVAMILTKKFRTAALALVGDPEAFSGWMSGRLARLGKWVLFGVGEADYEASLTRTPRPIRWSGLILLVILSGLVAAACTLDYGWLAKEPLREQLTQAAGAQVDIGTFSLRPLAAAARVGDLAVTDRTDPEKNSIVAKALSADLSITGFLQRSLVTEEITVTRLELGTKREKPGKVIAPAEGEGEAPGDEKAPAIPKDLEDLSAYLSQWEMWKKRLADIRDTIRKIEDSRSRSAKAGKAAPGEDDRDFRALGEKYGYGSITASEVGRTVPDLVIRRLCAEDIRSGHAYFDPVDIEIENMVYPVRLSPGPTVFRIRDKRGKGKVKLSVDFRDTKSPCLFEMALSEIPAKDLNDQVTSKVPVTFGKGTVGITGTGEIRSGYMDVKLYMNLAKAEIKPKKNVSIAGLRGKDLVWALENVKDKRIWVALKGDPANPGIRVEVGGLLEALKKTFKDKAKKLIKEETEKMRKKAVEELEKQKKKAKIDEILKKQLEEKLKKAGKGKKKDRKKEEKKEDAKKDEKKDSSKDEPAKKEEKKTEEDDEDDPVKKAEETLKKIFR